ncbi:hypothetical protein Btru_043499 [Bulinus truncatus]|nr:hypothetical protein Btru_043499 [Bulinus truncatus]
MAHTVDNIIARHMCLIFLATLLLPTVVSGERCSYKVLSSQNKFIGAKNLYLPTEIAHKDCQWGCCWDQKVDICCSFPMDAVVFAFIATLAVIVVVTLIVILLCYVQMKKTRTNIECNGTILKAEFAPTKLLILP